MAARAASIAELPPPITATFLPSFIRPGALLYAARNSRTFRISPCAGLERQGIGPPGPDGDEDVLIPFPLQRLHGEVGPDPQAELHPGFLDQFQIAIDRLFPDPESRDDMLDKTADLGPAVKDGYREAGAAEKVTGAQSCRARADDGDLDLAVDGRLPHRSDQIAECSLRRQELGGANAPGLRHSATACIPSYTGDCRASR